ncbi:hypothetical protein [Devosia nitrariae]|nr:hypothetical protein [Devosia nitrariae]
MTRLEPRLKAHPYAPAADRPATGRLRRPIQARPTATTLNTQGEAQLF